MIGTLHWLCVCIVVQLHALSAQQNKHLLSVELSQRNTDSGLSWFGSSNVNEPRTEAQCISCSHVGHYWPLWPNSFQRSVTTTPQHEVWDMYRTFILELCE